MLTKGWVGGVLGCVLVALPATGAVHRVPSQYSTIQAAMTAAVSGDSVLVAPGTYTNCDGGPCIANLVLMKSGVALLSEQGPAFTILRVDTAAGGISVVRGAGVSNVLLRGFTITSTAPYRGAVFIDCVHVRVEECHFVDLAGGFGDGAGLFADGSTIEVRDCVFRRCAVLGEGGGLSGINGSSVVERCLFEECVKGGATLQGLSSTTVAVRDCVFRNNTESQALIVLDMRIAEISGNVFDGNTSVVNATALGVGASISGFVVRNNLFLNNHSTSPGIATVLWSVGGEILNNTFVGNSAPKASGIFDATPSGRTAIARNNVFVGNSGGPAFFMQAPLPQGSCNLFWANPGGDYIGYIPSPTDLFTDPLFCDPAALDFRLMTGSPCLPENSPACGLIGAFGQGCGTIAVDPSSWGTIKNRFR